MSARAGAGRVAILDRDGTIVIDRGYLDDPAGLEFLAGAAEGLRTLYQRGFRLVVVSNQSGVGRGLFPLERVLAMNARLQVMAHEIGVEFEAIYVCPHAPDEGCACRKPAQALMQRAAAELDFEPQRAIVIGDKESDIEFGRRAGAFTILIAAAPPGSGVPSSGVPGSGWVNRPDAVAADLRGAAAAIQTLSDRLPKSPKMPTAP